MQVGQRLVMDLPGIPKTARHEAWGNAAWSGPTDGWGPDPYKTHTGAVTSAPYGFCPICGAPGVSRERCIDGNDHCARGHVYPSKSAAAAPSFGRPAGHVGGSYEWWWAHFGQGTPYAPTRPSWTAQAQAKLAAMEQFIAQGKGDTLVDGGGCTEPGGGIVPTRRTARETAALMRRLLGQESTGASAPSHVGSLSTWIAGETASSVAQATAPLAVPLVAMVVARLIGASWPLAIMTACAVLPIVWYETHKSEFGSQS